jgi:hypothetical protein
MSLGGEHGWPANRSTTTGRAGVVESEIVVSWRPGWDAVEPEGT